MWQILGIARFQIKTKYVFSFVGILTILCWCRLQTNNFDEVIFVHKNWSNDIKLGCEGGLKHMENVIELKTKLEEELARVIKQMFDVWCTQSIKNYHTSLSFH